MSRADTAAEIFSGGFSCSQAVLAAFCESYGLDRQTALRLSAGFGGGAKCAELCGTVSGALMVIGLKHGNVDPEDKDSRRLSDGKAKEFLRLFRERNGHVVCRELLRAGAALAADADADAKKRFKAERCMKLVRDASEILEQLDY